MSSPALESPRPPLAAALSAVSDAEQLVKRTRDPPVTMLHPSALAVDHIWEKFRDVWIHPNAETTMQEVASIRKAKAHRPFNPTAQEHQNFLEQLQKKMETLKKEFPFMSFE